MKQTKRNNFTLPQIRVPKPRGKFEHSTEVRRRREADAAQLHRDLEEQKYFAELLQSFRQRSTISQEAHAQATRIINRLEDTSFAPPTSDDDDDDDAVPTHGIIQQLSSLGESDPTRKVVADALRKADLLAGSPSVKKPKPQKHIRPQKTSKTNLHIVYADFQEHVEDDNSPGGDVNPDEATNVELMIRRYTNKLPPSPPEEFSSTVMAVIMEQFVTDALEVASAADELLRVLMDTQGRQWRINSLDGELARIRFHAQTSSSWQEKAKEHASTFAHGSEVITRGAHDEVALLRRKVAEVKEECESLQRTCDKRIMEKELVAKKVDSLKQSDIQRRATINAAATVHQNGRIVMDDLDFHDALRRLSFLLNTTKGALQKNPTDDERVVLERIERLVAYDASHSPRHH